MINRDVIQRVYISLLFLLLNFPHQLHARGSDINTSNNGNQNFDKNYDSYENYMTDGHDKKQKESHKDKKNTAGSNPGPMNHKDKKPLAARKNFTLYTVHKGDTVTGISKKFNMPAPAICSYNNIKNDNSIKTGAIIKIPLNKKLSQARPATDPDTEYRPLKNKKPQFKWPLTHIVEYKKDEFNGVRPIGIIITGYPGSSVLSSASGVVKKIGQMRGFGKYVVINHPGRYATVYANLGEITVSEGEKILTGYMIGKINKSDKRIHFQIDFEGKPENPLKYLLQN